MVTYFIFIIPHVLLCLFAARKLHNSYLRTQDQNVHDFQRIFIVLGFAFALSIVASLTEMLTTLRIIVDPLLTIGILFFFRVVFRILRKPLLGKITIIFGTLLVLGEIFLKSIFNAPAVFTEVLPFYAWAYTTDPESVKNFFGLVRALGGSTVTLLFLYLGRMSTGASRIRYLLIGSGLLLLPLGLLAGYIVEIIYPLKMVWPSFAVGSLFALVGLAVTLLGIYYKLPEKS